MAFPRNKHQVIPTPPPLGQPPPLTIILSIPTPPEDHHRIHLIMIIMACMASMLIFLCTISLIRKRFRSRANNRNRNGNGNGTESPTTESPILFDVNSNGADEEEETAVTHPIWLIRTVGLQQTFIDSITVFQYGKEDGLIDGTECSVCLGEFQHGESLRLLPKCSHAFHIPCIDTWLSSHKNCPLCRAPVARDEVAPVRPLDQNISNDPTGENVSDHDHDHERQESYTNEGSGWSGSRVETQLLLRRSVSVDSSSSSAMFGADVVVDLSCDGESSESGKCNIGKEDVRMQSSMSSSNSKKKSVSMRRSSFSNSSNFFFSRHSRSLSSTLPL